ncbi:MAG: T9SS type A sorting domain-containing protein [Bacteroidia bacterium]
MTPRWPSHGNIINGYQRMLEFEYVCEAAYPGDPNWHRTKVKIDGVVRMNFKYDFPNLLWGGKGTAMAFLSGTAGPLSVNTLAATIMADDCATRPLIPLKQADGTDAMLLNEGEFELDVYPNPVIGDKMELRSNYEGDYEFFDLQGQMVRKGTLTGGRAEIAVDGLPSGTYVLRYQVKEGRIVRKVVVN